MRKVNFENGECFTGKSAELPPHEIFGHVERNGVIVVGTAGWFETSDFDQAAKIAAESRSTSVAKEN